MGADAADVRGRAEPRRRDPRAARARRRRDASRPGPIDIAHQSALDRAAAQLQRKILEASVPKGQQPTPSQVQAAIEASRELFASGKIPPPGHRRPGAAAAAARRRRSRRRQRGATASTRKRSTRRCRARAGMTALLHAARQGHLEAARALLDGGAPINQVGAGDATSPLLMAVINGEFDLGACSSSTRGANPNLAAERQRRDAAVGRRQHAMAAAHALSAAAGDGAAEGDLSRRDEGAARRNGADPNARLQARIRGISSTAAAATATAASPTPSGSTAFWRAAYATDLEAMKLLIALRRRSEHPDDRAEQRPSRPRRRAWRPAPARAVRSRRRAEPTQAKFNAPPVPYRRPGRAARFMPPPASNTAKASPATPIVMRRTRGWR